MNAQDSISPDLLKRFVPTPYTATVVVNDTSISLETNSALIVAAVERLRVRDGLGTYKRSLAATVILDQDAPDTQSSAVLISAWPLVTLVIGTGTIVAFDCERQQLLAFLAPCISPEQFATELLPSVLDLVHTRLGPAQGRR